jgi:hydroxymethylpyrimidine/phosphomethylpyrimidine kinase
MSQSPPVVLTIAGFDPSSGAGVTADIKTIAAHCCYGLACITALTVQSTQGVSRVEAIPPQWITDTLEHLAADFKIAAIHVGMLGNAEASQAVVKFQKKQRLALVLDPVLRATSGAVLLDLTGQRVLVHELMSLATVTTPNVEEAAAMTGLPVTNHLEMKAAATKLHEMGAAAVVITGGDLQPAVDLLSFHSNGNIEQEEFRSDHQSSRSTHGTGCAFSTALACNLALGKTLAEAVMLAKAYVTVAIAHGQAIGRGTGPVHHLYRLDEGNFEKAKSRPKTV